MPAETEMLFAHSSAPKSVKPQGSRKYRANDEDVDPLPISSDPRVIRGSTNALARKVAAAKQTSKVASKSRMMSSSMGAIEAKQESRPTYRFDVMGHVGSNIDLTECLVSKDDGVPIQKREVESQVDAFKARPPSPAYIPRKTGIDVDTQVHDVRELFDFDAESDPIVSVIVEKTLEQAIFEVRHEEELKALELVADDFSAQKAKELEWQKVQEEKTMEEYLEHKRQVKDREVVKREEHRVKSLIGGVAMMQQLMPTIFDDAAEELYQNGTWRRPERATVEDLVLRATNEEVQRNYKIRGLVVKMVEEIFMESQKMYEDLTGDKKSPKEKDCIVLQPVAKAPEAAEGEEAATPPRMEEVKIFDSVSLKDVLAAIKSDASEKGITTELTLAALHDFFAKRVGRNIAVDGALVNFSAMLPAEVSLEV